MIPYQKSFDIVGGYDGDGGLYCLEHADQELHEVVLRSDISSDSRCQVCHELIND